MFAINDRQTYDYAMNEWITWLENHAKNFNRVLLVGNKKDMKHKREVDYEFVQESINSNPMVQRYIEISCKDKKNIQQLVEVINSYTLSDDDREMQKHRLSIAATKTNKNNEPTKSNEPLKGASDNDGRFKLEERWELQTNDDGTHTIIAKVVGSVKSAGSSIKNKCCH